MALTTIDNIYFPSRGVLRALQRLVVCILLWYYIFQALWAAWTLAFKTFQNMISYVITAVTTHPIMAIFLVFFVIPMAFGILELILLICLCFLCFRERDMPHGPYATNYQPMNYSGNVPRSPTLAHLQSQGERGGGARYRVPDGMRSPSWDY